LRGQNVECADRAGETGSGTCPSGPFGSDWYVFCRGLDDEPTELLWAATDGSPVLVIYLREGCCKAAHLPLDGEAFVQTIERLRDPLAPHAATPNLLLMNGTDHMEPMPELPALIRHANERLADARLIHGSQPQYIEAVRHSLSSELQTIHGELRSPKRHPLLPGVLSARMWIKQRNAVCQTLLEK
jgi:mannosylglycerate hydrolase